MKTNPYPRMHVSYYVKDLNETVQFYNTFFGQEPEKVKPHYAKYILENPSLIISFVENPERVQANFGHLGIEVESKEEMERRLETARNQGIVSKEEIGTACCYALQDKFWVSDPDGVQWEVYYFHGDSDFNDPHYSEEETAVCCLPEQEQKANERIAVGEACCEPGGGCC